MSHEDPVTRVDGPQRVLVADQDPLVRRVVRDALRCDGISVVAEAADGLEAVRLASELTRRLLNVRCTVGLAVIGKLCGSQDR